MHKLIINGKQEELRAMEYKLLIYLLDNAGRVVTKEELLKNVWEDEYTNKFYRGKEWAESGTDGNGLGLYIAKMLMKKMNGDLIPESNGDGLTVTLVIPLS